MQDKILLVDDEPNVLLGYQRLLHGEFQTDTAVGASAALTAIQNNGPFAVVLSDMQMPEMNGIQFLTRVKTLAPDTVRIMLTGHADVQTALSAVNEGNIFRFLTKPAGKEVLTSALSAGISQYRLVSSEKELIEKTLTGSLTVLTEVLSLASPAAFSRAMRLRRYVSRIATKMALSDQWRFEIAALLSQLGCVTLAPETIDAVYAGQALPEQEQALYDTHPGIACDLLKSIPRMEAVAWIIAHQNQPPTVEGDISNREMADMRLGAELLRIALAFDFLIRKGNSRSEAAHALKRRNQNLDPRVLEALIEVESEASETKVQSCAIGELVPGMVIDQDLRTDGGFLIVAQNQEVTPSLILKLKNYHEKGVITGEIAVFTMQATAVSAK